MLQWSYQKEKRRTRMKKNWLLRGLSVLAVGAMLVGCSSKKEDAGDKTKDGKEVITYAIWDTNQEPGMKKMAEKFEEKNPDVKVNVEVTPWDQYWTKLDAAATGESLPDVFWMHSNEAYRYMSNDMLLDLTDSTTKAEGVELEKFPKDIVEFYSLEGKQYAIPKDIDTIGLWYNKTLFDEAGVEYPDANWTWDDLVKASIKLTDESKGIYGFAAPNNGHEGYWNFIFQNEGTILNSTHDKSEINQKNSVEALQFYADFITKHKVSPTADQMAENKPVSFMQSGRLGMGLFGSWMLADFKANDYMKENVDVAVLPKGKVQASVYNGLGNAVAADTKHKEAAVKFVEFLGSEEANLISAEEGSAIPAYEGTATKWVDSSKEYNVQVYIDMLDYAVIRPFSKETIKVETIETDNLADVLSGAKTAKEGADIIAEDVNNVLK